MWEYRGTGTKFTRAHPEADATGAGRHNYGHGDGIQEAVDDQGGLYAFRDGEFALQQAQESVGAHSSVRIVTRVFNADPRCRGKRLHQCELYRWVSVSEGVYCGTGAAPRLGGGFLEDAVGAQLNDCGDAHQVEGDGKGES